MSAARTRPEEPVYEPGTVLAGKYRVERTLGVGGFGIVLQALHEQLDERVAIKILLPEAAAHATAPTRFVREARSAAKIRSEHVARVKDVGQLADSTPYMVMEYLEGEDLSALVKRAGRQAVPDVCEWLLQACEAIAEAHGLGMVHRDLKPANLYLTHRIDGTPCVKVLDFGISKLAAEANAEQKGMTSTSDVMGSPYYMSPEQMRSTRDVDARADVWALGAILFELLAGEPPFDAETMTGLIVAIMQEPPRDLANYRQDVPPQLRAAVLACLQKDAASRWQDVLQLATAIAPFAPPRAQASLGRVAAALGNARSGRGPFSSMPSMPETRFGAPAHLAAEAAMTALPATVVSPGGAAMVGGASAVTGGAASGEWARSVQTRRSRSPAVWVGVAFGAIALLGTGAFALMQLRGRTGADAARTAAPASPVPSVEAAPPAPLAAPVDTALPSASVDATTPVASTTGASVAAAPPARPGRPPPAPSGTAAAGPPPGPTVPPLGHRPGGLRPSPSAPPPKETSAPAAPPPRPPPSDPFGKPI